MASVFDARHYRELIVGVLDSEAYARGGRTRLAEAIGVQLSFISAVLGGRQDFTPEHGMNAAEFFGFDEEEKQWLILLISHARAGSVSLKRHYERAIEKTRAERKKIKAQIRAAVEVDDEVLSQYFGTWYAIVIHMCLRNPKLRDADSLAAELRIHREHVNLALKDLEKMGFAKQTKTGWQAIDVNYHVSRHSPALRAHLTNWRSRAVNAIDEWTEANLHYSVVLSLDASAFDRIREKLLEFIKEMDPVVKAAKDEQVVALNLDLFKVTRP